MSYAVNTTQHRLTPFHTSSFHSFIIIIDHLSHSFDLILLLKTPLIHVEHPHSRESRDNLASETSLASPHSTNIKTHRSRDLTSNMPSLSTITIGWLLSLSIFVNALPRISRSGKYLYNPDGERFYIKVSHNYTHFARGGTC